MKQINKGTEPKSLTEYRSSITHSDLRKSNIYEDFKDKTKEGCSEDEKYNLRKQLLEEQGYICCYCMSRIDCNSSKIEHFKPQTKNRDVQIDYQNLFIACNGGEGKRKKEQYCDSFKGEDELNSINLLGAIEQYIKYSKLGDISSVDSRIDKELNTILNLNNSMLKRNRKQSYQRLIQNLNKRGWTNQTIKQDVSKYEEIDDNGKYYEFSQMIVYFLTKKLKSKGETK
ncbi:MAG: retron system putative HNH endonuclease [Campylobacterota bacterium]|nr:retron system putative HNH endonuclease [Campylobacterota bacterium]